MDAERIEGAILAHRRLTRVYRKPSQAPEWFDVMDDLQNAADYLQGLTEPSQDQLLLLQRVLLELGR